MENVVLQLCRVCLIGGVKMYKLDGRLRKFFLYVIHPDSWSEQMPQYICYECVSLVHKFVNFKLRCQRAEHLFMQLVKDFTQVSEQTITNEHRSSIQSCLSSVVLGEDQIINTSHNDNDTHVLTPVHIIVDGNIDCVVKPEPHHEIDIGDCNDEVTHTSDLDQLWTEEIIETKKKKLRPKKKKHNKLKVSDKKEQCVGEESRDEHGLRPEEAQLKTHFTITTLTLSQQKAEIESRKESPNYLQSPYKCDICYKGFLFEDTWTNHSAKHKPECGKFVCPVCGVRFPSARKLNTHARTHRRSYACTMCHFVTTHLDPARKHKQWHTGVTYECQYCGEVSKKLTSHLSHVRLKHPSPYVCSECGFSFVSDKGLKMHIARMHKPNSKDSDKAKNNKESSWECSTCSLTFQSEAARRRHHATQHSTNTEAKLPLCRVCGVRFPSCGELRAHNATRHLAARHSRATLAALRNPAPAHYPATCEQCGEQIPDRKTHWRHYQKYHHQLSYPLVRNYICEICGKGCKSNAYLVYHRRTHFPERSFVCPQCPKSFHNRGNLSLHTLTHNTQRPYACDYCGKCYKTRLGLTKHMRCHDSSTKEKRRQRKINNVCE